MGELFSHLRFLQLHLTLHAQRVVLQQLQLFGEIVMGAAITSPIKLKLVNLGLDDNTCYTVE